MLVLATISLLPSLPPAFCRDSKDRATNNNSRVLPFPELVGAVLKPVPAATSTVLEAEIMIKVLEVPVPWMTRMLVV